MGGAARRRTFCVGAWLLSSTTARDEVEFAAGYTSGRTHTGLWRLGRAGRVLRRPDRLVPPPGWYPSPYYPGLLQRWEGPGWKPLPQRWWRHEHRYFRAPAGPFLQCSGSDGHRLSRGQDDHSAPPCPCRHRPPE
jgi:hypothetical protein